MKLTSKILCTAFAAFGLASSALAQGADVVISQVFAGGGSGSASAVFRDDFVELFNRSASVQNIGGWSLQYQSSGGTTWSATSAIPTGTTLQPGQYYLIQLTSTGTPMGGAPTATPDFIPTTRPALSNSDGKVALSNVSTAFAVACPSGNAALVDLVAYGAPTATCREGSANAATPGGLGNAVTRSGNGCNDTNQNGNDFTSIAVNLRNTATVQPCSGGVPPSGTGSTLPSSACPGTLITFTVTTTQGTPASTISTVTGDFLTIGLTAAESFVQSPANTWTFTTTLPNVSAGNYSFPVTITDALGRVGNSSVALQVVSCAPQITTGTGASPSGICNGTSTTLTVNVTPGQNPASASYTVTVDLALIGGVITPMTQTGPTSFQLVATVPAATAAGLKALPISVTDDQNRTDTGTITIFNDNCTPSTSEVVISQVYGGGGNTGATLTNDFVEIFNRSGGPVDITGWSVQYASASNANGGFASGNPVTNVPVVLSGTLQAGQYYLVQMAAGAGGTQALPTPDAIGAVAMGLDNGRIALVRNSTPLLLNCTGLDVADLVGYGTGATTGAICFEGSSAMNTLSNTTAGFRQQNGCQDNDSNRVDFFTAAPAPRNTSSPFNTCVVLTPTGACCTSGPCAITTQAACTGTYQGNNTTCASNPCPVPTGACCNGTSCSIQTAAFCGTVGGTYQGDNSTCAGNPCGAPTGVCCRGSTCNASIAQASCVTSGTQYGAAFSTLGATCGTGTTTPCCYADYDKTGGIQTNDIFAYLNDWFASSTFADFGGDGTATPDTNDIFSFLNAWFAGGC
ncbi:MAG: lamin tail domain-containing protein [Phycisphaerales bacterium]|nr:lamin tail domain-containing protein [Phycisphaerales bacterium]